MFNGDDDNFLSGENFGHVDENLYGYDNARKQMTLTILTLGLFIPLIKAITHQKAEQVPLRLDYPSPLASIRLPNPALAGNLRTLAQINFTFSRSAGGQMWTLRTRGNTRIAVLCKCFSRVSKVHRWLPDEMRNDKFICASVLK